VIPPPELEVSQGRPQLRLQAFREILNRPGGVAQRLPDLAPQFPFRLGEGPRDWVLPYILDDRIIALGIQAIEELFDGIADRRQSGSEPSVPPRYGLRRGIQPWGLRLAVTASELDPLLDPALVEAWCDRSAGALGEELSGAFTRALEAELLVDRAPPYGCLMALASIELAATLKERIKSRAIRGLSYERLEKALGFALFALVEVSANRAIQEIEHRPRPRDARPAIDRVRLCLNPLSYCSIRTRALQNGLNPWWLPDNLEELWLARRADELLSRPIDQLLQIGLDQVLQDAKVKARYAHAGRQARFRHELLKLLWEYDRGTDATWGELRAELSSDERLGEWQADSKALVQRLRQAGVSPKGLASIQKLFALGQTDLEDLQLAVGNQIVYGLDRQVANHVEHLAHQLRDARAEGDVRPLAQLYEQGRLYRLSADQNSILQVAERRLSGHLFVDLKGFTQRTVRAKEIVVADFLRREFYEPILRAAGALSEEGREVKLLNLVGDAAVFSGDVPLLVKLATDIRRICKAYQRTLAGVDPGAAAGEVERDRREIQSRLTAVEEPLRLELSLIEGELTRKRSLTLEQLTAELQRMLQGRASELARAHHEVREKLATVKPAERDQLEARMLRLSEAQEALAGNARSTLERLAPQPPQQRMESILDLITGRERTRAEELNRALRQAREEVGQEVAERSQLRRTSRDSSLEAGVFVSYGAAPEEIRMEDAVFGEVKVAVAEKLNEAARGTGRSSKVAEEVAETLRSAVARTGNHQLRDPFSVYVGARSGESDTEIFNVGEAMSGEALQVFLQRAAGQRYHFEKLVRRADLAAEICERFAIPERFKMIVSLSSSGSLSDALLFRDVGFVLFRGFEEGEGCEVFEILSAEHHLTKLLAQHHLQRWADEAKANPKQLLTGLPNR